MPRLPDGEAATTVSRTCEGSADWPGPRSFGPRRDEPRTDLGTAERFGDVHVLFNNAGVGGGGPLLEPGGVELWDWTLGVNLWGVLHGIKAFGPQMVAHGEPCHIVSTASIAGRSSVFAP